MSVATNEFSRGIVLNINNEPWQILEFHFVNPGKGAAFTRTNLKNLKTGKVVERSFKSGESFEEIELEYKHAIFLFKDRRNAVFSLASAKERISIPLEQLAWELNFLKENTEIDIRYLADQPNGIKLPAKVDLKVIEAPPAIKGNTATGGKKTVKVETGYELSAPIFIEQDEVIIINTQTGEYSSKA
jgi:elongation factor P